MFIILILLLALYSPLPVGDPCQQRFLDCNSIFRTHLLTAVALDTFIVIVLRYSFAGLFIDMDSFAFYRTAVHTDTATNALVFSFVSCALSLTESRAFLQAAALNQTMQQF